jgi:exodeoxyribonuclease VII large subunit
VAGRGAELTGLFPGERLDALSISALFDQVQRALAGAFPRGPGIWIRGEIQQIAEHRSGHCYMDLVDPDAARGRERPTLKVNCWRTTWGPQRAVLAGQGITLEVGMVVTLRGRVEFYPPRSQVNFIANEIDVAALLGRLAAQRAALLKALEAEGLLRRNASLPVPEVPLRVGLVASPRTEGLNDFLGQLLTSPFAFQVLHTPVPVQGARAPAAIAAALQTLAAQRPDVTVVVRGGGAKADLAAFDTEVVARAIATHPVSVWTGIGHTGDQSVADIVANRALITPTECGQAIVHQVADWWSAASARSALVARRARAVLQEAETRDSQARHRLGRATRHQLHRHGERLAGRAGRVAQQSRAQLEVAATSVRLRAERVGPRAAAAVDRQHERLVGWRRLLAAYDVERQLERGYSLTLDDRGRAVRSVSALTPGQQLVTRFADGSAAVTVDRVDPRPSATEGSAS